MEILSVIWFIVGIYLFYVVAFAIPWLLKDNNSKLDRIIKLLEQGKNEET